MPILKAVALERVYGRGDAEVRAVNGVALEIERGQVVLIMGPSGSGKTTLLFLLGGLLRPTAGRVLLDGRDITSLPPNRLSEVRRTHVGFVFQDFNLLSALTARENVEVALNLAGRNGGKAEARASELLDELGMAPRADFMPEQLSGGEKQRVSIARALANDPTVVLADEPTANLDSAAGRVTASIFREIAADGRRSVIMVSHDARILDIADRVFFMEDGRISEPSEMGDGRADREVLGMPGAP